MSTPPSEKLNKIKAFFDTHTLDEDMGNYDGKMPTLHGYLQERIYKQNLEQQQAEEKTPVQTPSGKQMPALPEDVHMFFELSDEDEATSAADWTNITRDPQAQLAPISHWLSKSAGVRGNQINSLDTEFTPGLEPLMKNPMLRCRVVKQRLQKDILTLQKRLAHYEGLPRPTPSMVESMALLRHRLRILRQHQMEIDVMMEAAIHRGPWIIRLWYQWQRAQHWLDQKQNQFPMLAWCDPLHWIRALRPEHQALSHANENLHHLTQVVENKLAHPELNPQEDLGSLISRYDSTMVQVNALRHSLQVQQHQTFLEQVWQHLSGAVQKLSARIAQS